jgi:hypothetical protein
MSSSRILRAAAVGVFTAAIVLSSPAHAAQRGDDPRDPIVRFIKYVKKIFTGITLDGDDDAPRPPHP